MTPKGRGLSLVQALRIGDQPRLALVGSGGKTTALFRLARQLRPPVLLACSTHFSLDHISLADRHSVIPGGSATPISFPEQLPPEVILYTGPPDEPGKLAGLSPEGLRSLHSLAQRHQAPLLIEADGSRGLPLKAPGDHEPVIPSFVSTVVVTAGLAGLGKPLEGDWVHRPEGFASLAGISSGERVSGQALARVLTHPRGGLKNIPERCDRVVLLNQADSAELQDQARRMASELLDTYRAVLVTSLDPGGFSSDSEMLTHDSKIHAVYEKAAGVVLAAGESRRFGSPKQLLEWHGEPLVRHATRAAIEAGLDPVLVVLGAYQDQVRAALSTLDVTLIENTHWKSGQSTSVQAGVEALPPEVGSALFLLADQPHIPLVLIRRLVESHAEGLAPLVAPRVAGRRANPVLFDRAIFPDLLSLSGDVGGRGLFERYTVEWVDWDDPSILLDVDTPEDYQALLAG